MEERNALVAKKRNTNPRQRKERDPFKREIMKLQVELKTFILKIIIYIKKNERKKIKTSLWACQSPVAWIK